MNSSKKRQLVKAQVRDGEIWVSGHRVGKHTRFDHRDLEDLREDMPDSFIKEGRKIRYNLKRVLDYYNTVKQFKEA